MQNGAAIFIQGIWQFNTKLKIHFIQPRNLLLVIYTSGVENLCPHKNRHIYIYRSFIHSYKKTERIQDVPQYRMYKQTVAHPHNKILFSTKYFSAVRHEKTWGKLRCLFPSERSTQEKAIYYNYNSKKFQKMKNYGDNEKINVAKDLRGEKEMNRWSKGHF
jgi:hypothetical protein